MDIKQNQVHLGICPVVSKLWYLPCLSVIICKMSVLACVPDGSADGGGG